VVLRELSGKAGTRTRWQSATLAVTGTLLMETPLCRYVEQLSIRNRVHPMITVGNPCMVS
jgi:hypothetical protein